MKRLFLLVLLLLVTASRNVCAYDYETIEETERSPHFEISFENDFVSRYVWRGFAYTQGPAMQPALTATYRGFQAEVWSNFVLNDEPNQGRFNEVDPSIEYEWNIGKFKLVPQFEIYTYPNQKDSKMAGELGLEADYELGPISLKTVHFGHVVHHLGAYFGEFDVVWEHDILPVLSVETEAGLAWATAKFNQVYGGLSHAALNYFRWRLAFEYTPVKQVSLQPHMEVYALTDGKLRAAVADPQIVCGGLLIGLHF